MSRPNLDGRGPSESTDVHAECLARRPPSFDAVTPHARRYCLITPCRDEAEFARRTIQSVARQSIPPALWVIVDDGSRDETASIVEEAATRLPYVRLIRRPDRGSRKVGGGVIETFNEGYASIDPTQFDYMCKFDLDLEIPHHYFEDLMLRMEADPRLGTCSGKSWFINPRSGALESEYCGDDTSVGPTKFYRMSCFQEIGGFVAEVMWDGIDCHRCRQLGWIAESVNDERLRFTHLRAMGSSDKGLLTGRTRVGAGQYFMGTSPAYYLASAVYRLFTHPPVIGSAAMLWGYFRSALLRRPRYGDREFRVFLRRYQRMCLLRGKAAALAALNERQASVWRQRHSAPVAHAVAPEARRTGQSEDSVVGGFTREER